MADFIRVGDIGDFTPGVLHEACFAGRSVLVVNDGGTLHALSSFCPHLSLPLAGGFLSDDVVVCPFHGSAFQLTSGECAGGPAAGDSLDVYEVKVEAGGVFVALP